MARQQKKLGEILVEWRIINPKELQRALDHAKAKNLRIGEALVDLKLCSESNVYKALAQQHNMEYVELDRNAVPANAAALVPDDLMRKYLILPLGIENGRLRIAVHDPLDLEMLDILRYRLNKQIRTSLAPHSKRAQLGSILAVLANLKPTGKTDIPNSLHQLAALLRGKSLVMLFSDLLTEPEPFVKSLYHLHAILADTYKNALQKPDLALDQFAQMLAFPSISPADQCEILLARSEAYITLSRPGEALADANRADQLCVRPQDHQYIEKLRRELNAPAQ